MSLTGDEVTNWEHLPGQQPNMTVAPARYQGLRLGWSDVWHRGGEQGNPYAHHVTGLHPVIDLNTMTLLEIEDSYEEGAQAPDVMGKYLPRLIPMPLREVAPLEISQPEGPGFILDGHSLSWQNWPLRLGFNHREGLVLHQVAVRDGMRLRRPCSTPPRPRTSGPG